MISLNEQDNNRSIAVHTGDHLLLTLRENAATAFKWHLDPYNENVLTLESSAFSPPSTSQIGASGNRIIRFRAIAPGGTVIRLRNRRSWEPPEKLAGEFSIDVSVF